MLYEPVKLSYYQKLQSSKYPRKYFQPEIYLFKFNNGNTKAMCKICSKLTRKAPERRHRSRSSLFVVKFEHEDAHQVVLNFLFYVCCTLYYNNFTEKDSAKDVFEGILSFLMISGGTEVN